MRWFPLLWVMKSPPSRVHVHGLTGSREGLSRRVYPKDRCPCLQRSVLHEQTGLCLDNCLSPQGDCSGEAIRAQEFVVCAGRCRSAAHPMGLPELHLEILWSDRGASTEADTVHPP